MMAERKKEAANVIQKWYRGHLAREKCKKLRLMKNVNSLHFHFERIRVRTLVAKAPIIWRYWERYKIAKVAKKRLEDIKTAKNRAVTMAKSLIIGVLKPRKSIDSDHSQITSKLRKASMNLPEPATSPQKQVSISTTSRRRSNTDPKREEQIRSRQLFKKSRSIKRERGMSVDEFSSSPQSIALSPADETVTKVPISRLGTLMKIDEGA